MSIVVLAGIPHELRVDAVQLLILNILLLLLVPLLDIQHLFSESAVFLHLQIKLACHCKLYRVVLHGDAKGKRENR